MEKTNIIDNNGWTIVENGDDTNIPNTPEESFLSKQLEAFENKLGNWQEYTDLRLQKILDEQKDVSVNVKQLNTLFLEINKNLNTFNNSMTKIVSELSQARSELKDTNSQISGMQISDNQLSLKIENGLSCIDKSLNKLQDNNHDDKIDKIIVKINNIYDQIIQQGEREKNLRIRNYHASGMVTSFMPTHTLPLNKNLNNTNVIIDNNID